MTGSIRQRGANSWQVTVELGGAGRKRKYKNIRGTKKDAEAKLREIIYEIEHDVYHEKSKSTLAKWLKTWLEDYIKPKVTSTTYEGYVNSVDNYIVPYLGDFKLSELTTLQIQGWIFSLQKASPRNRKRPMSGKSIRNIYLNLKSALDKAVIMDLIQKNPCTNVELPKVKRYEPTVYQMSDIEKLMNAIKGTDLELPLNIAIALGLRRGELLALRWCNIDFDDAIAHIRENRVEAFGKAEVKEPKTYNGIRDISIPKSLLEMLRTEYERVADIVGEDRAKNMCVVCKDDGNPFLPDSFTQKFHRMLKKNNLLHVRLHDLRHMNATILLKQGVPAKVVQERLGHADISTTLNIYSHVLKEVDRVAAEELDKALYG